MDHQSDGLCKNILLKQNRICTVALIATILFSFSSVIASDKIEKAGDLLQILIPGIAYVSTFHLDDEEGRRQFYKSFATNFAATHGLKYIIEKDRPNGSSKSFPSGHTSAAFREHPSYIKDMV